MKHKSVFAAAQPGDKVIIEFNSPMRTINNWAIVPITHIGQREIKLANGMRVIKDSGRIVGYNHAQAMPYNDTTRKLIGKRVSAHLCARIMNIITTMSIDEIGVLGIVQALENMGYINARMTYYADILRQIAQGELPENGIK